MRVPAFRLAIAACVLLATAAGAMAEDWPTYQKDNARSAVTSEALELPLSEIWVYRARHAPRPAWPEPAKRDIWHDIPELSPSNTYDRAFHTVAVGDAVYFGSSSDDQVYCLDAATGCVRWRFFTDGPVRLAPTIAEGKVYVGSDDGWAYCLDAATGELLWRYEAMESARRLPGNGRVISLAPVRTGLLLAGGNVHFFAGLFPSEGVYRCVLDAKSGKVVTCEAEKALSPQGYLLASPTRLFVPTGRTGPQQYELATGKDLGPLKTRGGAYALVVGDMLVNGPGLRTTGGLDLADAESRETIIQCEGRGMIVRGDIAYVQGPRELSALDYAKYRELGFQRHVFETQAAEIQQAMKRQVKESPEAKENQAKLDQLNSEIAAFDPALKACILWRRPLWHPYAMILAGEVIYLGGDGELQAVSATDGADLWTGKADGKVYGLAVANGALLASTDLGRIHCFRKSNPEREHVVEAVDDPAPYAEDELTAAYARAADEIVAHLEPGDASQALKKGYCVVLDCGEGRLAYELAKRTDMAIIGVDDDERALAAAREALSRAGVYGVRVSVQQASTDRLPFTSYFANVIVADGPVASGHLDAPPADEVARVLRPFGGLAMIGRAGEVGRGRHGLKPDVLRKWAETSEGAWHVSTENGLWARFRREAVAGGGEWTQLYADSAHTACSGDTLEGPMHILWFGEPGPREMIDRHHRPMSSLFKNGRLFVPANDLVIAVDPYNGTNLWKLHVPNSRRVGALRNCGHMLATDDYLYVAVEGECWAVDPVTGARQFILEAPQLEKERRDWGYLDMQDDVLFGTGMRAGASLREFSKPTISLMIEGDFRPMIASSYLFALDRNTGKVRWTHEKGVLMNNGISLGDGRIYFVQSESPKALEDDDGRLRVDWFCASDTALVALDAKTGKKLWQTPFQFPFEQIMYLNNAHGVLLATGTDNVGDKVQYDLYGFDAATGAPKWHSSCQNGDPTGGSHGEQWQHPVIIGNRIFSDPFEFDLQTGEQKAYVLDRGGNGCGGLTASLHYLYGRGSNPRMYPINVEKTFGEPLTRVNRPGCWLNIIPAGGIIVLPESSSGCTCGYPIQTSFGFIPEAAL